MSAHNVDGGRAERAIRSLSRFHRPSDIGRLLDGTVAAMLAFLLTALLSENEPSASLHSFSLFQVCKFQVGSYSYNMEKMIFEVTHLGYSHTSR